MPPERSDTERIAWLEKQGNGIGLVHDDEKQWAVGTDGMQNIRSTAGEQPADLQTTYLIDGESFFDSIREAIDAAMDAEASEAER